jgi:hypothetical protein
MALPTITELLTLDVTYKGSPFCEIAAKSGIDTSTLDITYLGMPFTGLAPSGGVTTTWKMYVGSVQASKIYAGATELIQSYIGSTAVKT